MAHRKQATGARSVHALGWCLSPSPLPARRPPLAAAVLGLCLALGGCDARASGDDAAVRDSADVEIVENLVPAEGTLPRWQLTPGPRLEMGAATGDTSRQLFRVTGATRLAGGGVALASGLTSIRFYGPDEVLFRTIGREGRGPGEFGAAVGAQAYRGDSLLVWDPRLRRVTVLDSAGRLGRTTPLQRAGYNPTLVGPLGDGSLLLRDGVFEAPTEGPRLQTLNLVRHSPEGAFLDSLGTFPSFRTAPVDLGGGRSIVSGEILGPRTVVAAGTGRYAVGTARSYEVAVHSPEGELERLVRLNRGREPVTDAHAGRYEDWRLAAVGGDPEGRRRVRRTLEQVPMADRLPAYDDLRLDREGNLWVRDFQPPWRSGPRRWLVFDREGRLRAEARLPDGFDVFEIGQDYVLGVGRDELGVERVRLYGLRRPAP